MQIKRITYVIVENNMIFLCFFYYVTGQKKNLDEVLSRFIKLKQNWGTQYQGVNSTNSNSRIISCRNANTLCGRMFMQITIYITWNAVPLNFQGSRTWTYFPNKTRFLIDFTLLRGAHNQKLMETKYITYSLQHTLHGRSA